MAAVTAEKRATQAEGRRAALHATLATAELRARKFRDRAKAEDEKFKLEVSILQSRHAHLKEEAGNHVRGAAFDCCKFIVKGNLASP